VETERRPKGWTLSKKIPDACKRYFKKKRRKKEKGEASWAIRRIVKMATGGRLRGWRGVKRKENAFAVKSRNGH